MDAMFQPENGTFNFTTNCTNCSVAGISTYSGDVSLNPVAERIFFVLYILAIILGAGGNLISIVVFANGRRCNTDIRAFLINLAVADLMMALICIPFSFTSALLEKWIFSKPMCPIILFIQVLSVTVSVYTNTAISVDRFIAIRFPLRLLQTSRRHVLWVIAVIWLLSISLCAVQLWVSRAGPNLEDVFVCGENWPNVNIRQIYTVFVLVITYVIPVMLIMTMYSLVCIKLWYRTTPGVEDHARNVKQLKNKRKVVKMLMTMSSLFTFCWMPLHLFFLIADYKSDWMNTMGGPTTTILYFSVNWLAMSNSFQNPIIYGFLNDNFRSDLAELALKCCPKLSQVKAIQRAALSNPPLHRLSTKMTLLSERGDSRADLYKNGRRSVTDPSPNSLSRKQNRRPMYNNQEEALLQKQSSVDSPKCNPEKSSHQRNRSVRIKSAEDCEEKV